MTVLKTRARRLLSRRLRGRRPGTSLAGIMVLVAAIAIVISWPALLAPLFTIATPASLYLLGFSVGESLAVALILAVAFGRPMSSW